MSGEKVAAFAGQPYLNLESYRKNGEGVRTPLWFAEEGGALYISTPAESWKVKRIRRNPKVRIVPSTLGGKPRGEWVEASARIEDGPAAARAQELLIQKYGWQKKLINFFARLAGRKSVVISLHLS
ncbi:MAG: PPOX class F420-dependent oxidoreductase [Candidatus Acidiferrales bacterium]